VSNDRPAVGVGESDAAREAEEAKPKCSNRSPPLPERRRFLLTSKGGEEGARLLRAMWTTA